jgi:hypothetical protein
MALKKIMSWALINDSEEPNFLLVPKNNPNNVQLKNGSLISFNGSNGILLITYIEYITKHEKKIPVLIKCSKFNQDENLDLFFSERVPTRNIRLPIIESMRSSCNGEFIDWSSVLSHKIY